MFPIKFIVKEAPNYSKECWWPVLLGGRLGHLK